MGAIKRFGHDRSSKSISSFPCLHACKTSKRSACKFGDIDDNRTQLFNWPGIKSKEWTDKTLLTGYKCPKISF